MNLVPRALLLIAAAQLLTACHYPSPPIPPSIPVPPGVYLSLGGASVVMEGVRVDGRLAEDGSGLTVQVYNESQAEVMLLLAEWTLTAGREVSPVYTGTAIQPDIGEEPGRMVRLAPGELHIFWLGMASRLNDRRPFKGAFEVKLSFVFEREGVKRSGVLSVPPSTEDPL